MVGTAQERLCLPYGSSCCLAIFRQIGELPKNLGGAQQPLFRRFPILEEYHLHVRPYPRRLAVLADEIDQPVRLRELVVAEGDDRALRAGVEFFDIGSAA